MIEIKLPDEIEQRLRRDIRDIEGVCREAALVELYRRGEVSHGELAAGLSLSRYEVDGLLRRYGVTEDLLTEEELDQQVSGFGKLAGS